MVPDMRQVYSVIRTLQNDSRLETSLFGSDNSFNRIEADALNHFVSYVLDTCEV